MPVQHAHAAEGAGNVRGKGVNDWRGHRSHRQCHRTPSPGSDYLSLNGTVGERQQWPQKTVMLMRGVAPDAQLRISGVDVVAGVSHEGRLAPAYAAIIEQHVLPSGPVVPAVHGLYVIR